MRLLRLELRRYGHLADTALDFNEAAPLQVVYGANEAGKSTALAAVSDALFGFKGEAYAFRYLGPQLRLAMSLLASDGTQASFVRRKGLKNTLLDDDDAPLPEEALRRFLGGATRDLFEKGFGLDGDRLRKGGLALLQSGGDVGESLIAGTGIGTLRTALQRLDDEAKTLSNTRGKPRLQEAAKVWQAAQAEIGRRAVLPAAWKELETLRANAEQQLAAIRDETGKLATEQSRLERARRVLPLLRDLGEARAALVDLGEIPALPPDAAARRQAAIATASEAARDAARESGSVATLQAERDFLQRDPAVLIEQDTIDSLAANRGVMEQAFADLPTVRGRALAFASDTAQALRHIGFTQSPEQARDAIPSAAAQERARGLIAQRITRTNRQTDAEAALGQAVLRRDAAKSRLDATPAPTSAGGLRRALEAVRAEGRIDADLARAERACGEADIATARALHALPLWTGTLADLVSCPVPLLADTEAVAGRMEAASREIARLHAEAARVEDEIGKLAAEAGDLARGEVVPTPDAIGAARQLRDQAWHLIRREHAGGAGAAPSERQNLAAGALPDVFEALRDIADRLADRASGEAKRVASFLAVSRRQRELEETGRALQVRLGGALRVGAAEDEAWVVLWASGGMMPSHPAAMAEWRQKRGAVLVLAEKTEAIKTLHAELQDRSTRAMARLDTTLGPARPAQTVADRLLAAEEICITVEASIAAYERLVRTATEEGERLPALADTVTQAKKFVAQWQADWAGAVPGLGLGVDASVEMAEAALAAWAEIAARARAWREDERRIVDMQARIDADTETLHEALSRMGAGIADEAAPITTLRLSRRLAAARAAETAWIALDRRIRAHEVALATAHQAGRYAADDLAALCDMAGALDDAGLEQAIARAGRGDGLAKTLHILAESLRSQSDGHTEDALRREVEGIDVDAAKARLDDIAALLGSLGVRREEHSAFRNQAETGLARMRDGQDAASKAQEAEDALAEARSAAERYARVHVARVLLRAGIERFRRDNQGPLLRAAGGHFALLTGGRYAGLGVDEDDRGHTELRALRDDGTECPVHGLSEGTRDQLFLALRVAAVQAQAGAGDTLPFIADDLLVHFDDVRAAAALRLLVQLGQTTQVILFTHHDHIAALAQRQAGAAVQHLGEFR